MKTSNTNTSTGNINCRVCNRKSNGIFYSIPCCRKCKDFFRKRNNLLRCKADGKCKIDFSSRTNCSACRYKQCLEAGMKKLESDANVKLKFKVLAGKKLIKAKMKKDQLNGSKKLKFINQMNNEINTSEVESKQEVDLVNVECTPKMKLPNKVKDSPNCSDLPKTECKANHKKASKVTLSVNTQKQIKKARSLKKEDNSKIENVPEESEADSLILTKKDKQVEHLNKIYSEFESFNPHQELDYEYLDDDNISKIGYWEKNRTMNSQILHPFQRNSFEIKHEYPPHKCDGENMLDHSAVTVIFTDEETNFILSLINSDDVISNSVKDESISQDIIDNSGFSQSQDTAIIGENISSLSEFSSTTKQENCVEANLVSDNDESVLISLGKNNNCVQNDSMIPITSNDSDDGKPDQQMLTKEAEEKNVENERILCDDVMERTLDNDHHVDPLIEPFNEAYSDNSELTLNSLTISDIDVESDDSFSSDENIDALNSSSSLEQKSYGSLISSVEEDLGEIISTKKTFKELLSLPQMQPSVKIKRLSDRELNVLNLKRNECDLISSSESEKDTEISRDSPQKIKNLSETQSPTAKPTFNLSLLKNFKIPKKVEMPENRTLNNVLKHNERHFLLDEKLQNPGGIDDILDIDVSDKDLELESNVTEDKGFNISPKLANNSPKNITETSKLKNCSSTDKKQKNEIDNFLTVTSHDYESKVNSYNSQIAEISPRIEETKSSEHLIPKACPTTPSISDFKDKEVLMQIKNGYCFRSLRNKCFNGSQCVFTHLPLDDERISPRRCFDFFTQAWKTKQFDITKKFVDAIKKKNDPIMEKKIIEIMVKNSFTYERNVYEAFVLWKDVDRLNGNQSILIHACRKLYKRSQFKKILVRLQKNKEWFVFWKVIECTLNNNCILPSHVVCNAFDSLPQYPSFTKAAMKLLRALPLKRWSEISPRYWDVFLKHVEEYDSKSADHIRNKLKEHVLKFPQLQMQFSCLFCGKKSTSKNEMDLPVPKFSKIPSSLKTETQSPSSCSQNHIVCLPKNHMTFHVSNQGHFQQHEETHFNYVSPPIFMDSYKSQKDSEPWCEDNRNVIIKELSEFEEREQLSKIAANFLYSIFNNQDMKNCLNELHLYFLSDSRKTCARFTSFLLACLSEEVVKDEHPRVKRYLSQIGVVTFLELRQQGELDQAYEILKEFHKHNINYIELQEMSGHGQEITRSKLALAVVDVCSQLQKHISAINVLKASEWALPCCSKKTHELERISRLHLLSHLLNSLLQEHCLHEAQLILMNLFDSFHDDMNILREKYLINIDLSLLCDRMILSAINSKELQIGVLVYQKALDYNLTLDQITLRTLFVSCLNCNISAFCEAMFLFCCNSGVYPQQKVDSWPWSVEIYSYFTSEEIYYVFQNYLRRLANFLFLPENQPTISKDKQVLKINIQQLSNYDNISVDVLRVSSTVEAVIDRIMFVTRQRLQPPLCVVCKGSDDHRILEVTAKTLQDYLCSLGVKPDSVAAETTTTVQYLWPNFRKPTNSKNTGYFNPFSVNYFS